MPKLSKLLKHSDLKIIKLLKTPELCFVIYKP